MASRNLPPSFFNAHYNLANPPNKMAAGELMYGPAEYSSLHHHLAAASQDPWQYAAQVCSH